MMNNPKNSEKIQDLKINLAIRNACQQKFGVLDSSFLCQSIGILHLKSPLSVKQDASIAEVVNILKHNKVGCILVVDADAKLIGIFSERDCVLKVIGMNIDFNKTPISTVMTPNPVSQGTDCTIAYALNLMSHGGFRHLPVVDDDNHPVSMLSIKDIIDHIVTAFTQDLLGFSTDLEIEGLELEK